ncbi:MAG: hypothetical protein A2Z21_04305 [Candidatus Fraserbacteria bacterium RBG_16_55_9]|uniref:DUF5668 domain-containing protein n=1 Tax=Fraserbacteria sp. (strain RBG_16_55_9) TaxID=1817864 RepID=A0A1F5UP12_FRAXR|nr:MAG: hypothetical protein A2Z21_04305 [Candidatus Fraserbacteria bacterium RBG_16_55_9]
MAEKIHSPHKYLFWGLVFVLVGGLWRLSLMGWFELSWRLMLPGLLIVFGLSLIISGFFRRRPAPQPEAPKSPTGGR